MNKNIIFILLIIVIIISKLIIMGLFSSDYQNELFIPFIKCFYFNNPWDYTYNNHLQYEFPYYPFMLYVYSIGIFLIKLLHLNNIIGVNIIFKLPTLLADFIIFSTLLKIFKGKEFRVLFLYYMSPIILYSAFMHSQLDILPVMLLFLSIYALKKQKIIKSSIFYGLAISTKLNTLLVFPIILIYLLKNKKRKELGVFFLNIVLIYLIISMPYLFSYGYKYMVLLNNKQNLFFNFQCILGNISIYIPLFIITLVYFRFFAYKKINNDLLDSFVILSLALFLLFIPPSSPAWYIWILPFLCSFAIKYSIKNKNILYSFIALNVVYLLYFIFFYIGDYKDLLFLNIPISFKIHNTFLNNCTFTILEAILVSTIYLIYKIGVKSNSVYKNNRAFVIGIGGDSGSGKSTIQKEIQNLLKDNIVVLEGDGDHKWERDDKNWQKYTHLDPKSNLLYQQMSNIVKLKHFEQINRRDYDHSTGKFSAPIKIMPKQFILLSGLHPFYLPKMRRVIDLKVYLDPDIKLLKYWKIKRDVSERGYSIVQVLKSIKNREVDTIKYIKPQRNFADVIISFSTDKDFNYKDISLVPNYNLRIDLPSSVNLDQMINYFHMINIDIQWDYSDDLNSQYIIFNSQIPKDAKLTMIAYDIIENIDEIIQNDFNIPSNFNGVIQLIILKVLSEKMKENYD